MKSHNFSPETNPNGFGIWVSGMQKYNMEQEERLDEAFSGDTSHVTEFTLTPVDRVDSKIVDQAANPDTQANSRLPTLRTTSSVIGFATG